MANSLLTFTFMIVTALGATLLLDELRAFAYAETNTPLLATAKVKKRSKKKAATDRKNYNDNFNVTVPDDDTWSKAERPAPLPPPPTYDKHMVGVVGAVNFFGSGAGLEYLYGIDSKISLGANLLHTYASLKESGGEADEFINATNTHYRFFAKYEFFPLLYTTGGLDLDTITGTYGWKGSAVEGDRIATSFNARILALDLAAGSEWKGPYHTYIGCDWIGVTLPLGGSIDPHHNDDVELTSEALKGKKPNQRLDSEISAQLQFHYLSIRLGARF